LPENTARRQASSWLFEIALVLVRLDHVACRIVNADHSAMCAAAVFGVADLRIITKSVRVKVIAMLVTHLPLVRDATLERPLSAVFAK
jgi:hypothetical protein